MNKFIFLLSTLMININSVFAVTLPGNMKQTLKSAPNTPGLANIVAALLIVILLIYIVGWIYMKLSSINAKGIFKQPDNPELNKPKILSGISLGQNRHLYVIELNNKYLAVGVTPNNINLIKEFDKNLLNLQNTKDNILNPENIIKDSKNEDMKIVQELFSETALKTENTDTEIDDICKKYL